MVSRTLFDRAESHNRKSEGMTAAAQARTLLLEQARNVATSLAAANGETHMDEVFKRMQELGFHPELLGNASGSVFLAREFEFTGKYFKSERVSSHARDIKVWRLR